MLILQDPLLGRSSVLCGALDISQFSMCWISVSAPVDSHCSEPGMLRPMLMRDRLDARLDLGVRLGLDRLILEDRLDGSDGNGLKPFTSIICRRQPLRTCMKCRLLTGFNFPFTEHTIRRHAHCLYIHLPTFLLSRYLFTAQFHNGKLTSSSEVVLPPLLWVGRPALFCLGSPPQRAMGHTLDLLAVLRVIAASSRLKRQACTQQPAGSAIRCSKLREW